MLIEHVVVIVLVLDSLFWHHDPQQDASIFLKHLPLLHVLESEVFQNIEVDGHICGIEDFYHTVYVQRCITCDFGSDSNSRDQGDMLADSGFGAVGLSSGPDRPGAELELLEVGEDSSHYKNKQHLNDISCHS